MGTEFYAETNTVQLKKFWTCYSVNKTEGLLNTIAQCPLSCLKRRIAIRKVLIKSESTQLGRIDDNYITLTGKRKITYVVWHKALYNHGFRPL